MLQNNSTYQLHLYQISLGLTPSKNLSLRWSRGLNSVDSEIFVLKNGKHKIDQILKLQFYASGQTDQNSIISIQQVKEKQKNTIGLAKLNLAQQFSRKKIKFEKCESIDSWVELSLVKFRKDSQDFKGGNDLLKQVHQVVNSVQRFQYLADLMEQSNQIRKKQPTIQIDQKRHLESIIQSQSKKLGDLLNLLSDIGDKRILQQVNKLLMA